MYSFRYQWMSASAVLGTGVHGRSASQYPLLHDVRGLQMLDKQTPNLSGSTQ